MTKAALLLATLVLFTPFAAATEEAPPLLSSLGLEQSQARKAGPAPDSPALFVPLPSLDHAEGTFDVRVEIFVDGASNFVETMRAEAWPGLEGPTALPVLSSALEQREALRAMAEEGTAEVRIAITVEGREEVFISLAEAIEQHTQLFSARFRPLALRFETPAPAAATKAGIELPGSGREGGRTCEDTCEVVYERCMQRTCTPGVPRTCQVCDCPTCNAERQDCLDDCNGVPPPPPGCTQPTVTEYIDRSLAGFFPSGGLWCFITNPFNISTGRTFEEIILVYENRRIRRTEACDGTVTLQVIGSFTTYGNCNFPTFFVCPGPIYYPFDICP